MRDVPEYTRQKCTKHDELLFHCRDEHTASRCSRLRVCLFSGRVMATLHRCADASAT